MADPPTVDEFASRYKPQQEPLEQVLERRGLWAAVDTLKNTHHLGWTPVVEYLRLHGVETTEATVSRLWRRRQTR